MGCQALVLFNPYDYMNVPERFKGSKDRWNELANYILDSAVHNGHGLDDLRLDPRPGVDHEKAFRMAIAVLEREDLRDFHKCAVAAWLLWTGFEKYNFYYD